MDGSGLLMVGLPARIMLSIHNPHYIFAKIRIHQIYWIRRSAEFLVEIRNPKKIFGQIRRFADPFTPPPPSSLPQTEKILGDSRLGYLSTKLEDLGGCLNDLYTGTSIWNT